MLLAEIHHLADSGDGEPGLPRAGLVIKAGVEHAAVVPALMAADAGLFFENGDAGIGKTLPQPPRGCESDDAPADDYDTFAHLVIIRDMLIVMKAQATEADIERVRE